ncbi:MAG: BON domain-containing protein [Pseudomonadota bacterium]|nr:BON domain-containing protein [Pseudomonadales bacterium]MEC7767238.1 BON domain-containing protein [Pseudomonadota bacterium]HBY00050.1 phospholipid-binding protein [Gammaproteobacteria bacterium]MEC8949456.1 BON domain-containing protein [Pseudomonadota bacterium]MEC8995343.1 BON domain-containing protein [Pseudomonadota bacterium]|tara:strand:- start:2852 stop:3427 length:576 start_codon:yes stop_codon:yes gene_type:complete
MNFFRASTLMLLFISCSCTTILVQTTGEEGILEDPGERTAGAMLEDQSIETKVKVNMRSQEPAFRQSSFDVISHNGVVLLVGQVESKTLKNRATKIASKASSKVRRIHNELEVAGRTSLISRTNDTWIATKVRTLLYTNDDVPSDQVRVIAENGAVYLMGLISQAEGDNAANLARNISGVTKVVKVFEYIN